MNPLKSILVVDNEPGFHDLFRFHLEALGFEIDSAYDGLQGWECFQKKSYDVVFSDVHMPKMKGPELVEKIRETHPDQQIVIMSSFSDPDAGFESRMETMGVAAFLYKPFEIDHLTAALEQALGAIL